MLAKILMHVCCGPCSIYPLDYLRGEGHNVHGYFFNPNIHPYTEYIRRKETLDAFAEKENWPVIFAEEYPLEEYFRHVAYREGQRCRFCYAMRLLQAVRVAKRGKFDAFTTSLLVSPFQKHELIREVAEDLADRYDVPFYYVDFRKGFKEGVEKSKLLGMYRQQYCGCVFSEKERYAPREKGRQK